MFVSLGKLRVQPVWPHRTEFSSCVGRAVVEVVTVVWAVMVGDADSDEFGVLQAYMVQSELLERGVTCDMLYVVVLCLYAIVV
jgi:hypothetical protein